METEPLSGVFSRAWAFEPSLPSECPLSPETHCGVVKTSLPGSLRKFLDVKERGLISVRMSVATSDFLDGSHARIYIGVDGADANFLVSVRKVNGHEERVIKKIWGLRVERNFPDKTGEIEPHAEKQAVYLNALKDVMALWDGKYEPMEQDLLCRGCPSQIHRLPGSVA